MVYAAFVKEVHDWIVLFVKEVQYSPRVFFCCFQLSVGDLRGQIYG